MDTQNVPPTLDAPSRLWSIWAKWPRKPNERQYHPLICHMLDVASVARLMWPHAFTHIQRARIADRLGLRIEEAVAWIVFWSALHDLGKASPAFQTQLRYGPDNDLVAGWLRAAHLDIVGACWAPHGALSQLLLETFLPELYHCPEALSEQVGAIVGAHHGLFFTELQKERFKSEDLIGGADWRAIQATLARLMYDALEMPTATPTGVIANADALALAGFISVADWIGSNVDYFPLAATIASAPASLDLDDYLKTSRQRARDAMTRVAWDAIDLTAQPHSFQTLFEIAQPRAMQQTVIDLAPHLASSGLVIIESPMGEGKTEAAMYLADHWSVSMNQRGVYFALPSQATSNQMFGRVRRFLQRRFTDERAVNLHLAHGMSALSPAYEELQRQGREYIADASIYDEEPDPVANHHQLAAQRQPDETASATAAESPDQAPPGPEVEDGGRGAVIAAEWFTAPKRVLLSPYGVGTVDQALMAVLQVKHGFVRLFGLGGKTIIIDEVHAYDAYMSTLLKRLLEWLGALGAPVVLLSATLPAGRREELLASYVQGAAWPMPHIAPTSYPRVTYVSGQTAGSAHVASSAKSRTLTVRWVDGEIPAAPTEDAVVFPLARQLAEALCDGGCAAVICNTVSRAREMYLALEAFFNAIPADRRPTLELLHSQFLHQARAERENRVIAQYGPRQEGEPNKQRPRRSILVATQVIEQSLDLDFDLMVSDLAPIDLLLQRAGRLHRHTENDAHRPMMLSTPVLWVCSPETIEDGSPHFGRGDEFIYAPHILLRSWYQLWTRTGAHGLEEAPIAIPDDIEALIEAVYDDTTPMPTTESAAFAERWAATAQRLHADTAMTERKALDVRILPPDDPAIYSDFSKQLQEDDPDVHSTLQALTRDAEPSVPVVIVSAAHAPKRSIKPSFDQARVLLESSLNFSRRGATEALLKQGVPSGWRRTPWLQHHRLLILDSAGQARVEDERRVYTITVDPICGVIVTSQSKRQKQP